MSAPAKYTPSPSYDRVVQELDIAVRAFWFNTQPAARTARLESRIKMATKLLAKVANLPRSKALDTMSQALRFPSWHHLSKHLAKVESLAEQEPLPVGWLDALSAAALLTIEAEDDVTLPEAALAGYESFGRTLSMLTDTPVAQVLDGVSAAMCGGRSWSEVRGRSPLKATEPLYHFRVPDGEDARYTGGWFGTSPACQQLADQLTEVQDGYPDFTASQKKKARAWVEAALAAQPGFLDGGLALGWMQWDAKEREARATADRYVRMAESLIPKSFKGRILWAHLENRTFHRLHWLRLSVSHWFGDLTTAAKTARKLLRLNPNDNLGVRYVLPLLLLQQEDVAAAKRSLSALRAEPDLVPSALRAFVQFAAGDAEAFRANLARALFTLPALRMFLLNDPRALPADDSGYRGVQPDMNTFSEFAWPTYQSVPGLMEACLAFLAEPDVRQCEQELRERWYEFRADRRQPGISALGALDGWHRLVDTSVMRVA